MVVEQTAFLYTSEINRVLQAYLYVCKEREVLSSKKMFVVLSRPSDINDLTAEQLQFVSKDILLRVYGDYIDCV